MSTTVARRATQGTIWLAAASWIGRLTVLLVLIVLARHLDARQFGLLAIATLVYNIASQFGDAGMADAVVWWPGRTREAAETSLVACAALGTTVALLVILAAPGIAIVFSVRDAVSIIRLYAAAIALDTLSGFYVAVLTRDLAFRKRFIPEVVPAVCGGAVTIALAVHGQGVWSLVIGDVLRSALRLVIVFLVAGKGLFPRWHRDVALRLWRYGRAAVSASVFEFALQNVDYALIGLVLGPVALGLYTIAFRAAILPFLTVSYIVGGVAFPVYAQHARGGPAMQRVLETTMRASCAPVVLMGAGLAALAPFLEVLGHRWQPAVPVARLLGVYICLRTATFMVSMLLRVVAPRANALLRGGWVVLLAVLIATVGRTGITAVAAIQVGVATVMLAGFLLVGWSQAGISVRPLITDIARCGAAAMIAVGVLVAIQATTSALSDPASVLALLVLCGVFSAVYVAGLVLLMPSIAGDLRGVGSLWRLPKASVASRTSVDVQT